MNRSDDGRMTIAAGQLDEISGEYSRVRRPPAEPRRYFTHFSSVSSRACAAAALLYRTYRIALSRYTLTAAERIGALSSSPNVPRSVIMRIRCNPLLAFVANFATNVRQRNVIFYDNMELSGKFYNIIIM